MDKISSNIGRLFLSIVLICGLLPIFPVRQAVAEPNGNVAVADNVVSADNARANAEGVVIVYKDESLDIDEATRETNGTSAAKERSLDKTENQENSLTTLEDLGVVAQEVVSEPTQSQGSIAVAQLSETVPVEEAIERIESLSEVDYVQPNYSYSLLTTEVSDPYVQQSDNTDYQYYLQNTRVSDAWDYSKTDNAVTVAVIDTGADLTHPDLKNNINSELAYDVTKNTKLNAASVPNNGDANGHGTMVAGIVAAEADNGIGIAGASYNANILPIRVFNDEEKTTTADLIAAYAYLQEQMDSGALTNLRVINMSLGYYAQSESDADKALHEAIVTMLNDYGVLTVCAGGNGNSQGQANSTACYPSDFQECISVVATDQTGRVASFSDNNSAKDIAAPGVNILSTSLSGKYAAVTGTSAAAPQVSATLALMFAAEPSLSAQEARNGILSTTLPIEDEDEAVGLLNAQAAVAKVVGTEVDDASESSKDDQANKTDNNSSDSGNADPSQEGSGMTFVDPSDYVDQESKELTEESEEANSWRYANGNKIQALPEVADSGIIRPLAGTIVGWSKSNGTTSVTTASGTRVAIKGVKRVGIDVSSWQGKIDWAKVKADGISFALLRCASWDSKNNKYVIDPQFKNNVEGARANGIQIGVYIFSYADKVTGATKSSESEAKYVLEFLKQAGLTPSSVSLPVYYDLELDRQAGYGKAQLGQMAKTFCDIISAQGYSVGIYANQNWWNNYLTDPVFSNTNWKRWVARYPIGASVAQQGSGVSRTDIWQFSSRGTVNGVSGSVDMNFDYSGDDGWSQNSIIYSAHSSNIGWMSYRANGDTAGTTGQSKALEAVKIKLAKQAYSGSVEYRAHVKNIGWQNWVSADKVAGTTGRSLQTEAISIRLTGDMAKYYDVYYRAHAQNFGWMGWAKNGENAGSAGYGYRLEGIQVKLVKKGSAAPGSTANAYSEAKISYSAHVQNIGWQNAVVDGATAGTTGQSKRLEAIKINLQNQDYSGGIQYRTHIQNIGWENSWKSNGTVSGTSGRSLRLEAIQIKLTGEMANKYDIYYRVHAQNFGWMGWAKNGESAGTAGYSYRLEGIQIKLVKKGGAAPGSTTNTYKEK